MTREGLQRPDQGCRPCGHAGMLCCACGCGCGWADVSLCAASARRRRSGMSPLKRMFSREPAARASAVVGVGNIRCHTHASQICRAPPIHRCIHRRPADRRLRDQGRVQGQGGEEQKAGPLPTLWRLRLVQQARTMQTVSLNQSSHATKEERTCAILAAERVELLRRGGQGSDEKVNKQPATGAATAGDRICPRPQAPTLKAAQTM